MSIMNISLKAAGAAVALLALACGQASAQEINGRTGIELDWKLAKGLHLNAEYQLRMQDSFSGVERNQFTLGASYKLNKHLKAAMDYTYIGHYGASSGELKPRHRFSVGLTGSVDAGDWRFSLRESLQLSHKAYEVNHFQEVPNPLNLKSRLMAKYRGFKAFEPYAYVELRNIFNAPRCSATYNSADDSWSGYEFLDYGHAYVNRVRGAVGLEWNLSKRHGLDFTLMYNYNNELEIDTNKSGTKLKSYGWEDSTDFTLSVGYKFSF